MQKIVKDIACLLLPLFMACSPVSKLSQEENKKWTPKYRVQIGTNHGGIVENKDLTELENIEPDAFTGATKMGVNAGVHTLLPVRKNYIEVGLDYMLNQQTFNFADEENNFSGTRKVSTSQFLFPVTYNIGVIRKKYEEGLFQVKLGYTFQYNLFDVNDRGNSLPEYTSNNFSSGLALGFSTTAFKLNNGSSLGLYLDLYRGSQIYDDFYNRNTFEMPGSSYFKAGIIYHLKNK